MKIIKRIKELIKQFQSDYNNFGLKVATSTFLFFFVSRFSENSLAKQFINWRHSVVLSYLSTHFRDILSQYKDRKLDDKCYALEDARIWICWWQGEEFLDELTSSCIHSIRKHANGHEVVLITKSNYSDYVNIPSYIMDKFDNGIITFTQFSDILRMTLLNNHGGLWLDATMLVVKDIPEEVFESRLFTRKGVKYGFYVSNCLWTGFFMAGSAHSILFDYMNKMFFEYWKRENLLIDYYLIDYLIRLGYDNISAIRELIDWNPFNNPELHSLERFMNLAYDENIYARLISNTSFFKLSRKTPHIGMTSDGQKTFYGQLIKKCNHQYEATFNNNYNPSL